MIKIYIRLMVMTVALGFVVSSCTKTETAPNQPVVATGTATLDKTTAVPGEVVIITTSASLENKPSWEVTLGGQKVVLGRLNDKQAVFLVPALPSGTASLDLSPLGVKEATNMTIGSYAAIKDPAPVYTAFQGKLDAAVTQLEQLTRAALYPIPAQNLAVFKNMQQSLPAAYAAATNAQKLEAAYFMRQLDFIPVDFTNLAERSTLVLNDPSDQFMKIGLQFVKENTKAVVGVSLLAAGGVLSSPVLAIAGGAIAIYHLNQSHKIVDTLINNIGVAFRIDGYSNRSINGTTGGLQLRNGVPKDIRIEATYRTMQPSDAQGGPFLQEMMVGVSELKQARTLMQTALNQMRTGLLGSDVTLAPFSDVKTQAATTTYFLPASGLLIGNVSVAGIALSAVSQPGEVVTLTASSTTITAVTPFTFTATYINAPLGVNVRKTFDAEFSSACDDPAQFALLTGGSSKIWRHVATDGQVVSTYCGRYDTKTFTNARIMTNTYWGGDQVNCTAVNNSIEVQLCGNRLGWVGQNGVVGFPYRIITLTANEFTFEAPSDGGLHIFTYRP
ncbi:hypothetical protein [Hymenobacter psychrophilus]|uniref:Uncharacterized protein n=1 Tax=Hymenobacter psychrophilus TaxID=651662 RepID=A0A1H3LW39_9BACT|nr:hypothetical protein [Hymenobacter psychrophilus]SDY68543.1 hypothetical protein SAMN04488069_111158 [Hymenobacter psychrophilus]